MSNKLDELFANWDNGDVKITRKVPICLCIDVSGSMSNVDGSNMSKIEEVNKYVNVFLDYVRNDERAKKISDICIITFGGTVNVVSSYNSIENIPNQNFKAGGGTPLGEAVNKAVELLDTRRKYYKDNNIEHWKPIMLLMSDGEPTDSYQSSAANFSKRVLNNGYGATTNNRIVKPKQNAIKNPHLNQNYINHKQNGINTANADYPKIGPFRNSDGYKLHSNYGNKFQNQNNKRASNKGIYANMKKINSIVVNGKLIYNIDINSDSQGTIRVVTRKTPSNLILI